MPDGTALNFELIGHNIRCSRMAINSTQTELAHRAQVGASTLRRLEAGQKIHRHSLEKICFALGRPLSVVNALMPYGLPGDRRVTHVHRSADLTWFATGDRRKKVPAENNRLLQSPDERSRLARLGLVGMFEAYMVTMPYGPSISFAEVCGRVRLSPNELYGECIVYCLHGQVTGRVGDEIWVMDAGDAIGFSTEQPGALEPTAPIGPEGRPPCVLLVLGNRKGHSPARHKGTERKRIRHRPKASSRTQFP